MKIFNRRKVQKTIHNNPLDESLEMIGVPMCCIDEPDHEKAERILNQLDVLESKNPRVALRCLCWILLNVTFPKSIEEYRLTDAHNKVRGILIVIGAPDEEVKKLNGEGIRMVYNLLEEGWSLEKVKELFK